MYIKIPNEMVIALFPNLRCYVLLCCWSSAQKENVKESSNTVSSVLGGHLSGLLSVALWGFKRAPSLQTLIYKIAHFKSGRKSNLK